MYDLANLACNRPNCNCAILFYYGLKLRHFRPKAEFGNGGLFELVLRVTFVFPTFFTGL